jgi:hypothetical protein
MVITSYPICRPVCQHSQSSMSTKRYRDDECNNTCESLDMCCAAIKAPTPNIGWQQTILSDKIHMGFNHHLHGARKRHARAAGWSKLYRSPRRGPETNMCQNHMRERFAPPEICTHTKYLLTWLLPKLRSPCIQSTWSAADFFLSAVN